MQPVLLALVLFSDPWPQLPSESVCRERWHEATRLCSELDIGPDWEGNGGLLQRVYADLGATARDNIERRLVASDLAWQQREAEALKAFWWSAWWVRWEGAGASFEQRIQHAERCRKYLGPTPWATDRWWRGPNGGSR